MFDKIRRPGRSAKQSQPKKFFQFFIMGLICLIFVFLVPIATPPGGEGILAHVGREAIRAGDFQPIYENLRRQTKQYLERLDDEAYDTAEQRLREQALRHLVEQELLIQGAKEAGFFISDRELADEIKAFGAFQQEGRFRQSLYLGFLKSRGLTASRFEKRVQKGLVAENMAQAFQKVAPKTKVEKTKEQQKEKWKVRLNYAMLLAGDIEEETLQPLVQAKELSKITHFLKQNKTKWEKSDEFSPIAPFGLPPAMSENFMEALLSHLPTQGLIPHLIRDNDKIYIIHILSFKESSKKTDTKAFNPLWQESFGAGSRLFSGYMDQQKQKIKIHLSGEFSGTEQKRGGLLNLLKNKATGFFKN